MREYGPLTVQDTEVQVVRDDTSSALIADTNRSITAENDKGDTVVVQKLKQDYPNRRYPTIYLLHGINGGAAEWDTRNIDGRIDRLIRKRGIEQSIVIMPNGESLWYVDSSVDPWRSMFIKEMVPLVDRWYRTRARRGMRGLTGVSMGGQGAFTIAWSRPNMFSSIASHMGATSGPRSS